MSSIFGSIKVAGDLEQAAVDTLSKWFRTYLIEYELQAGLIVSRHDPLHYQLPRTYSKSNQIDRTNVDSLPAIVVVSPGTSPNNLPKQVGDGSFRVFFVIGIGVFVGAGDRASTLELVRVYTAICRAIMLQKQSLGGFADGSTWLNESYNDDFTFTDNQTISAGQVVFEIEVANIVSRFGGPDQPDDDDLPGDWPLVEEVIVTIVPEGVSD